MEHISTGTSGDIKLAELDIKTEFNDVNSLSNDCDNQFNAVIFGTKYKPQINDEIFNTDYDIHGDDKSNFAARINTQNDNLDPLNNVLSVHRTKKTKEISFEEENIKNEHNFFLEEKVLQNKLQYDFDHEIVVKDEIDFTEQYLMNPNIDYDEDILIENEGISRETNFACKKRKINIENNKRDSFSHRKENETNKVCIKEEILSESEIISDIDYQNEEIHSIILNSKEENVKRRKGDFKKEENIKTSKGNSKIEENDKTRKINSKKEENDKIRKRNSKENVKRRKEKHSHIQENQEIPLLIPISEKKTYICNDCGYNFNHLGNLKRHISRLHTHTYNKDNTQAFSCSNCAFKCSNRSTLDKHENEHKDKPFSCDFCEYTTRRRNGLNRHLKTHTGEKKYTCEICDRKCTTKRGLEFHVMIHSGKKPFSCDKCDFKAVNKHDVTRHRRIHTGEKPFSCEICGYACIRKYHLGLHMRKHAREH